MKTPSTPANFVILPAKGPLLTRSGWSAFITALIAVCAVAPLLNLWVPEGNLFHMSAYATYVVQGLFQKYLPGAFDWYLLAAVPVAFMASALMGAALERSVIRFLYGRPLETLLATWGISLMLQQLVRSIFGAQNVGVENPVWMSGGVQVLGNLSLPYNRLVIIGFAIAVLLGMASGMAAMPASVSPR